MSQSSIFPFRINAYENEHHVNNPILAKEVWFRVKEPKQTWYAIDLEILDENKVILDVYDIRDTFHGGIGKRLLTTEVELETEKEKEMCQIMILDKMTKLAEEEFEKREEQARNNKILEIRKELFGQ